MADLPVLKEVLALQHSANELMLTMTLRWRVVCAACQREAEAASPNGMPAAHELLSRGWEAVSGEPRCPQCLEEELL